MIPTDWFIDPSKPWRGVHRRISIASILPMGAWSSVRAIIESTPLEDLSRRAFFPRVTLACECCQTTIVRTVAEMRKHIKNGWRYPVCSKQCLQTMTNRAAGKLGPDCSICGAKMAKGMRQCSDACKTEARHRKGERSRLDMGTFSCLVCGTVKRRRSLALDQKFCSVVCKDDHHAVTMRGAANPAWRDGVNANRYDKGVQRAYHIARALVLEADAGKCVACSSTDRLHCHHIDHDSTNNRHDNLVTLCQKCHISHHARDRSARGKSPFPWLSEYAKARPFSTSKSKELTASSRMEFLSITA